MKHRSISISVDFIASVYCCSLAESNLKRFNHYYDAMKILQVKHTFPGLWNGLRIIKVLRNIRIERFLRIERFTD